MILLGFQSLFHTSMCVVAHMPIQFPELLFQSVSSVFQRLFDFGYYNKSLALNYSVLVSRLHLGPQAAQAQCVSLIINTCSFMLRNLKWP